MLDVIQKEAWPFYRTISGVRLSWKLEEPKGPKTESKNAFLCSPFYGRACRWAMLGELKPKGPKGHCRREVVEDLQELWIPTMGVAMWAYGRSHLMLRLVTAGVRSKGGSDFSTAQSEIAETAL